MYRLELESTAACNCVAIDFFLLISAWCTVHVCTTHVYNIGYTVTEFGVCCVTHAHFAQLLYVFCGILVISFVILVLFEIRARSRYIEQLDTRRSKRKQQLGL